MRLNCQRWLLPFEVRHLNFCFAFRSNLPYPGSQEQYEVCYALFDVGSTFHFGSTLSLFWAKLTIVSFTFFQVFIKQLVWNLFGEGNDVYKEGDWTKSMEMYTEALGIADYADSEDINVPMSLLEKLYANRAAACLNIRPVSRLWLWHIQFQNESLRSFFLNCLYMQLNNKNSQREQAKSKIQQAGFTFLKTFAVNSTLVKVGLCIGHLM